MNLKGRYDMVRQAALQLVGLPTDNIEELKALASTMRVAALIDASAAVSLLMVQTLIVTHSAATEADTVTVKLNVDATERREFFQLVSETRLAWLEETDNEGKDVVTPFDEFIMRLCAGERDDQRN